MASGQREPSDVGLVDRDGEFVAIDALLGNVRRDGGALLLRGPAGIGKTSLLDAARARAQTSGFRLVSTAGAEAESSFAFAGLQPLLLPLLAHEVALPEHLRQALRSALGLTADDIPALETVALATLGLLGAAASMARPLCVLVDDAQWLDASTAGVLLFVARRLSADPIAMVAAARDGGWVPSGAIPELAINPLGRAAALLVLETRSPELTPAARSRVMAEAQGNPLALVELPRALGATLRDPMRPLPQVLPLTARLEAAFMRQTGSLPGDTQAVLLAAALAPSADVAGVLAAAGALVGQEVGLAAFDRAVSAELVDVDGRQVHFRHPLVRSGLISATPASRRRSAHEALARVVKDPEHSLYHRAEARVGNDEELAGELDEAAGLALRRGSPASALAALEQAAALSLPGSRRAGRLVRAATLSFELGRSHEANLLLRQADGVPMDRADHVRAQLLGAAIGGSDTDDPGPIWDLIALARESIAADADDALRLLEFASTQIIWGEPGREIGRAVVATARLVPGYDTDPRVTGLLAHAMPIEGHLELAGRLTRVDEASLVDAESQRLVGFAAVIAGDYERGSRLLDRAERALRKEARLALLARVLTFRGVAAVGSGEWLLAVQVLDEAERLASETHQVAWVNRARQVRAGLAGMSGDDGLHRRIVDEQTLTYQRTQALHRNNHINVMRGKAAAMAGQVDDALGIFSGLFDPADPLFDARSAYEVVFLLADMAAVKNDPGPVERAVAVMEAIVPAPWPPILQSGMDYARAVTAEDPVVKQQLFESALAGPAGARTFDRARLQLAYGVWLRRQNRRLEARERLREARTSFDQLGNEPFAQRSRDELRATGEASRRRPSAEWDTLSPQELQIARLVAEGLSNRDIGDRLFLSHRTIGSHLYRMYPKLGVTSRSALAAAMHSK